VATINAVNNGSNDASPLFICIVRQRKFIVMDYLTEIKKCSSKERLHEIVNHFASDRYFKPCWRFWMFFEEKWELYVA
jgi:hypothetical protein